MGWINTKGDATEEGGGKAVRPALCLFACEAVGGDPEKAMPAAVALELVHNFSLIHDDIEDGDRYRRHRRALWAVWGEPAGIAAGNVLLNIGNLAIRRLADHGIETPVVLTATRVLTESYLRMMEGQYLDIDFEHRLDIKVTDYLNMIARKTGALIEAAFHLGALIGLAHSPDDPIVENLRTVGRELGAVFQIRDDMLGIWGGAATGKPVGADIQRKKKSLPVVHALQTSRGIARRNLYDVFGRQTVEDVDVRRVLAIMEDLSTRDYCQRLANERWSKARGVIESMSLAGNARNDLLELGYFLLVREN